MDSQLAEYIALYHASLSALDSLAVHYARHHALLQEHMLHILLFVPETVEPESYIKLVKAVEHEDAQDTAASASETAEIDTSPAAVELAMRDVILLKLSLEQFLERRVRATDQTLGRVDAAMSLMQAFPEHLPEWRQRFLQPLAAMQQLQPTSFTQLESMSPKELVDRLFINTSAEHVTSNLERIWLPVKHGRDEPYEQALQQYILDHAASSELLLSILAFIVNKNSLRKTREALLIAILGACYLHEPRPSSRKAHINRLSQILAILKSALPDGPFLDADDDASIDSLLRHNSLLRPNMLTVPVKSSALRLENFVSASHQFASSRYNPSIGDILAISLADEQIQRHQLTRVLNVRRSGETFRSLRTLLLSGTILTKLKQADIEFLLLKSCLQKDSLEVAKKTYITTSPRPLPAAVVEEALLDVFYETFDNANDLSKRSLQPAADILALLHPKHQNETIRRGQLLADAAMELATFNQNLCMPIELRKMDGESLRDLAASALQTSGAYKRWRRLLGILQNLKVALALPDSEALQETTLIEIVANAALAEDDLTYALVLAREAHESEEESDVREGAWRVAYQVSKYPTDRLQSVISQREVLEQALTTCPADRLCTLLMNFERLEQAEHKLYEGGAGVPSYSRESSTRSAHGGIIEMPRSLLQAAQAARQLTFGSEQREDGGRVRKRDQLAGLVGSGVGAVESRLTSGVSWLIGAE
jgi:hypothetical protein